MYPIRPLSDRVILKRLEDVTPSGLVIFKPEKDRLKDVHAVVVAVGVGEKIKGGQRRPMTVKVGDEVYLGRHAFYEIRYRGEELIVAFEDDIAFIVPQEDSDVRTLDAGAQQAA